MTPPGEQVRELRRENGLSIRQLAQEVGINEWVIRSCESGRTLPHPKNQKLLADYFGKRVTELFPL